VPSQEVKSVQKEVQKTEDKNTEKSKHLHGKHEAKKETHHDTKSKLESHSFFSRLSHLFKKKYILKKTEIITAYVIYEKDDKKLLSMQKKKRKIPLELVPIKISGRGF